MYSCCNFRVIRIGVQGLIQSSGNKGRRHLLNKYLCDIFLPHEEYQSGLTGIPEAKLILDYDSIFR